ncbi:MAG TPA: GNAT family N-acetyltransferase [Microthrixaceae bacterium]|nr:GNAT family N-acetyltransferase [Microthrixaceae bacterium]
MSRQKSSNPRFVFEVLEDDATEVQVTEIVDLVQSAYRGDASRQGWTTEADLLEGQRVNAAMVQEVLDRDASLILTVRLGERLVGCCELSHQPRSESAYLGMFAVSPELQAAGIGRMILDESERIATTRWTARQMAITVIDARQDLIAWYERRGYVRTGETGEFPYGDERFGIPLRDDLVFASLEKSVSVEDSAG